MILRFLILIPFFEKSGSYMHYHCTYGKEKFGEKGVINP
jgi:hypothetical protein